MRCAPRAPRAAAAETRRACCRRRRPRAAAAARRRPWLSPPAQGGARGLTEQLGYGNIDQGFPVPGGFIKQTTPDGQVDSLAYPLIYRDKGINTFMKTRGVGFGQEIDEQGNIINEGLGMLEGRPLGIGIDPRFTNAEREEYYGIINNARPRAQRMFDQVYNRFR